MKLFKKLIENKYKLNIYYSDKELNFLLDELEDPEIKIYELNISLKDLQKKNEDFSFFKTTKIFINSINTVIESNNFSIEKTNNNTLMLGMKNDLFNKGIITVEIPERKDLELKEELESLKNYMDKFKTQTKDEAAINSFKGTEILDESDKILISQWIHPHKIVKFNLLYTTKDSNSASTFHYYCDGIYPTLVIVKEDSSYKMKFGGYTTGTWLTPNGSATYSRAPGSFLFNLTKKEKYDLNDSLCQYAIYKNSSYGPIFGYSNSNADLYLYNGNTCYCNKYSYNTGNYNLLGQSGQTSFSYKMYEVYHVIFD